MAKPVEVPLELLGDGFDYGLGEPAVDSGPTRFVRTADLNQTHPGIDWSEVPFCSTEPPRDWLLREGDLLVARNGEGSIGNLKRVQDLPGPVAFSQNVIRIRPRSEIVGRYIAAFARTREWRSRIDSLSSGAAIRNISSRRLRGLEVPVVGGPAVLTQRVHELRSSSEQILGARQKLETTLARLDLVSRLAAKAAVSGDLDALTESGDVSDIDEDASAELVDTLSAGGDAVALLRPPWEIPEGWTWQTVADVCENHDSRRKPLSATERSARQGPYPYWGASGPIDMVDEYLFDGDYLLVSEDGSNLRGRRAPIAFAVEGKFWPNNHIHILQPHPSMSISFLVLVLNNTDVSDRLTGVAQPKLPQKYLSGLPVPVPPIDYQEQAVNAWSHFEAQIAQLRAHVESSLSESAELLEATVDAVFESGDHEDLAAAAEYVASLPVQTVERKTGVSAPRSGSARRGEANATSRPKAGTSSSRSTLRDLRGSILDVLRLSDGPLLTADVFQSLHIQAARIDEFYECLRGLARDGVIVIEGRADSVESQLRYGG